MTPDQNSLVFFSLKILSEDDMVKNLRKGDLIYPWYKTPPTDS
jgi:hypothetical protein